MIQDREKLKAVYLIHFWTQYTAITGQKIKKVQHYIGSTKDLEERIKKHKRSFYDDHYIEMMKSGYAYGNCGLIRIVNTLKINWHVSLIFHNEGLDYEYSLKGRKENPRLCPQCRHERGMPPHSFRNLTYTSIIHQTGSDDERLDQIHNPLCTRQGTASAFLAVGSIPQAVLLSTAGTKPRKIESCNTISYQGAG